MHYLKKGLAMLLAAALMLCATSFVSMAAETEAGTAEAFYNAVSQAQEGDVIKLTENITFTGSWYQIWSKANLTINGNGKTITLNAVNTSNGNGDFLLYNATNLTVSDLTIRFADSDQTSRGFDTNGGRFENVNFYNGDMAISNAGNVDIINCTFNNQDQIAIYSNDGGNTTGTEIKGCTFTDTRAYIARSNEVISGNALVCENDAGDPPAMTVAPTASATITGNTFAEGTQLKLYDSTSTVSENYILGAVLARTPLLTTTTIENNKLSEEAETALQEAGLTDVESVDPVATILGGASYFTIDAAIEAAQPGDTVKVAAGTYAPVNLSGKNITFEGTVGEDGTLLTEITGGNIGLTVHNFSGTIRNLKVTDSSRGAYGEPAGNITFDNVTITGATYGLHLIAYQDDITWTIQNCYMDISWANSLSSYKCEPPTIIIRDNKFVSTSPYYAEVGTPVINTFSPNTTIENNYFGENAKIYVRTEEAAASIAIGTNYYEDGADKAVLVDEGSYAATVSTAYETPDMDPAKVASAPIRIGEKYESFSLQNAVWAAAEGDVITVGSGTYTEGDLYLPATLKAVTIRGAEDKTSIVKDTAILSADGDQSYTGITFENMVFDNSYIMITGWTANAVYADWTITNCEFKNIATPDRNIAAVHFNVAETEPVTNFTFTGNVIDGVSGGSNSGLILQAADGEIVISNNIIKNAAWNAMQIFHADEDTAISVTGNTISGIGSAEGVFNLYGCTGAMTFAGNTVSKSTAEQVFFNNISTGTGAVLEDNTWLDADGNTVDNPGFEAAIGNVYYVTWEEAAAAAGADETVTLLVDVEITEATTIEKNISLNGNEMTIQDGGSLTGTGAVSDGTITVLAQTGDAAAIGGVSLTDVTVTATGGGNVFAIGDGETAVWENVNATVTGAATGLSIAAGGQLTLCGESMVVLTESTVSNLTVQGSLTIVDPAVLVAPGAELSDSAGISGEVMAGFTEAPVISPEGGSYKGAAEITITCATEGAKIYYTTDGTEPTAEAALYTAPLVLEEVGDYTVRAIAIGDNMLESDAVSAAFTITKKRYVSSSATSAATDTEETDTTENTENTENNGETESTDNAAAWPFTDVDEDFWGYEGIAFCYAGGIMNGMTETTFEPETALSRGMVVTMLYRMEGAPEVEADGDEWYAPARAWAMQTGVSDGTDMEKDITREQLVTMLYRYAKAEAAEGTLDAFTDADDVSEYAVEAMEWAVAAGIITGMDDGRVAPQGFATRAQAAAIFMRYMKMLAA